MPQKRSGISFYKKQIPFRLAISVIKPKIKAYMPYPSKFILKIGYTF